jgi:hypothetical protein
LEAYFLCSSIFAIQKTNMKKIYLLFLLLISYNNFAQITGTVSDKSGNPLPFVTVLEENTYHSSSTNEQGKYELNLKEKGSHVIVFKYLSYKTKKVTVETTQAPITLDVKLEDESFTLNEVVISKKNNPANAIIKSAIASKAENTKKTGRFKADFYSRGILKFKNLPKKILGQKIGDMDGALDSTGTGIFYLSETFSKLFFQKPNDLKEVIIASKVSGNDRKYSYNTARSSRYDFYNNNMNIFGVNMISPIASNAFQYYKYRLESTFEDENHQTINKIKISAKRDKEPVFEGFIYIVEDSWALYAVDLDVKGYRIKDEFLEKMTVKQNFSYNKTNEIWAKNTQSLEFVQGGFGINFLGKFTYTFSNYEFVDGFDKKTFTNEISIIETNSNKKDTAFWNHNRPIPLTLEESTDYIRKDSIHKVRNSKKYLDSIDAKENKFKLFNIINGYTYKNSFQKHSFRYEGLLNLSSLTFNTVQGWNFDSGFEYKKWSENRDKKTTIDTQINYGFADNRLRVSGQYNHQFNNQNYANLALSGGSKLQQFNPNNPISGIVNSVSTLFFKNNFMKLYQLEFAKIVYSQNVANGANFNGQLEYQIRKPVFNTTNYTSIKNDDLYTSNNPLSPNDYENAGFEKHSLAKISLNTTLYFGNKYIARPDGKYNIPNKKYPIVNFSYEKAFATSEKKYAFDQISSRITYDFTLNNKGKVDVNIKAGKFFNASNIAFMDYEHFNGNQTHITQSNNYLNAFFLMPYYSHSTNKSYFELHTEYNDKGYFMNKIPLLNLLKSNFIMGFHTLSIPNTKPYSEFTLGLDNLGFGKIRIFRIDYVRSFQNGFQGDGVMFGLKI